MNALKIPHSPNWYKSSILACAPDNTLIYGSIHALVVISGEDSENPPNIKVIHDAHPKSVISIDINKKWGDPKKLAVSLCESGMIAIWNLETFDKEMSCTEFCDKKQQLIGVSFAGSDRVVSCTTNGTILLYNMTTDDTKLFRDLLDKGALVSCISSCPHSGWLIALGLQSGTIVLVDLRRNGSVYCRLRGHDKGIISLVWCPAPINVFPKYPQNTVKNKPTIQQSENAISISNECQQLGDKILEVESDYYKSQSNGEVNLEILSQSSTQDNLTEILSIGSSSSKDFVEEIVDDNQQLPNQVNPTDSCDPHDVENLLMQGNSSNSIVSSENTNSETNVTECDENLKDLPTEKGLQIDNLTELESSETPDSNDDENFKDVESEKECMVGKHNKILKFDEKEENDEQCSDRDPTSETCVEGGSGIEKNKTEERTIKLEIIEEEPRKEYLLASSGRDRNIFIWRAGTDGRLQTFFSLPKKRSQQNSPNYWITLCWPSPNVLLSSNGTGELLQWAVPKDKRSNNQFKVIHKKHNVLLNIVAPRILKTQYNWKDVNTVNVWTFGQNGLLRNESIDKHETYLSLPCINSFVSCFASSPLDPNVIAISLADGNIKTWNLSKPHLRTIRITSFSRKVFCKITSLSWHPTKENLFAFGTEEGRIGYIDTAAFRTTLLQFYFRSAIHHIEWGPIKDNDQYLGLYAGSEGQVVYYNIEEAHRDPVLLNIHEKTFIYKFSWKPDYSIFLLNIKDGELIFNTKDMQEITTIYLNEKGLSNIVWHPSAKLSDAKLSPFCNLFAATTSKGFFTYDCSSLDEDEKKYHFLECYKTPIVNLTWSPFEENKLATISNTGVVNVWDITTKTILATCLDASMSFICIIWSPLDSDFLIGGGKGIIIWKISENPPEDSPDFVQVNKSVKSKSSKKKNKKQSKHQLVPFTSVNENNIELQIDNMRQVLNLAQCDDDPELSDTVDGLQLFGNKYNVLNLLTLNQNNLKNECKYNMSDSISLMKGDYADTVKEAIENNRVTPLILSLASMVSPKLWQEACEVYAKQLSEEADSDPMETASYFLCCHKIELAINHLCEMSHYKEALALAKCRLPENCTQITDIVEKWATYCIANGNFELAAICHISINGLEKAARILARRANVAILTFAAELAKKSGNMELYDAIISKSNRLTGPDVKDNNEDTKQSPASKELLLQQSTNGEEKCEEDIPLSDDNELISKIRDDQGREIDELLSRAQLFLGASIEDKIELD